MAAPSFWNPPVALSDEEERIHRRLKRTGRLFGFLRTHRHEIFDDAFQAELVAMYDIESAKGRPPVPPALLAMATLLQAYLKQSDAGAVEDAAMDRRWQLVLDCLGDEAPFSQGSLFDFRQRLIAADLDKRLLERTVDVARRTGAFGANALRAALDSAPLWGCGRVEDTFNLIAHAMDIVAQCAAAVLGIHKDEVVEQSKVELLGGRSLKAKLDIDWSDEQQKHDALQRLLADVERLRAWVEEKLADRVDAPPMKEALELLARVVQQDLEPDPDKGGQRIRKGVAADRRISIQDPDMRHGRKSKSRVFNGYKRHIAQDLDNGAIFAVALEPANRPEHEVVALLEEELRNLDELHIDRGFLASPVLKRMREAGLRVVAKPWVPSNGGRYTKLAFTIDVDRGTVSCPADKTVEIRGKSAKFHAADCHACPLREKCTTAADGRGRSISIHPEEGFHQELRARQRTPEGREELRQRVGVEHGLAHVSRRQGPRARYMGTRKNLFDLRRIAAVENLCLADRSAREAA